MSKFRPFLAAVILAASATAAYAQPLTVRTGETWVFTVKNGEPANAHKVEVKAKPAKGQIMVSVRALMGTTMTVTNNSAIAYTFRAELLQGGKATAARPCTLPANGRPIFEQWQQQADAIRISNFNATSEDGHC